MTKTITVSQWKAMPVVSAATPTPAVVRKDADGKRWQWVESGKRVTVKSA